MANPNENEVVSMFGGIPVVRSFVPVVEDAPVVEPEPEAPDKAQLFDERFEEYKKLVAAMLTGSAPLPPRTNEIDDTDEKLAYAMMAAASSVIAAGGGGILSERYTELCHFTVTTAVTEGYGDHPFARSTVKKRLYKQYKYRVTVNGESYVLPSQLFDFMVITGSNTINIKVVEQIGNQSLFRLSDSGLLNEKFTDVPFLLVCDDEDTGYVDLYTEEAGAYEVTIERVDLAYERIDNALIYDSEYAPFQKNKANSTYQIFSVGTNRFGSASDNTRTSFAFGYGNYLSGFCGFAFGILNNVTGSYACAQGFYNEASGKYSSAFGHRTVASGGGAEASGDYSVASGIFSHAEGEGTVAAARTAHVEGGGTVADESQLYTHVGGVNNATSTATGKTVTISRKDKDGNVLLTDSRTLGKYAEVIGNGDSDQSRSNARTLDWSGNEELAGSLTLGLGTEDETTITAAQLKALLATLQ